MSSLAHVKAKIVALHRSGMTSEQITDAILTEYNDELSCTYGVLHPVVKHIVEDQKYMKV